MTDPHPLPADARIGHVHLRVADLERAVSFYRDTLGFTVRIDGRDYGLPMVFLAAGGYHHHIALNTFESAGGTPPPPGHTGLFHVAIVYPGRMSLARAVARALAHGATLDGGRDHGGTISVYLKDPDGNGLELYYDVPMVRWFDDQGRWLARNDPFDPSALAAEAEGVRSVAATA
jgi:catechol 2,3-dioxygenase